MSQSKAKRYVATKDWFNGMEYIYAGKVFSYEGEPAKWMHEVDKDGKRIDGKELDDNSEENEIAKKDAAKAKEKK